MCSIPGLGPIVAAAILAFLPEIGSLGRKQAGSLAGLVPHRRESGQWKGKSFISGGRKPLRDALYMPALVAMRFNPDLKAKYTALREAGKPAKVALVALMRKLIETANALVKADRPWVENRACA
ncbi:transposase [Oceanicella actignis]|uniref:transposase n=1 Tax=Oceanicella actignis TaxID=1189325 RepID=UPI0024AF4C8A|nr:transposase [Oceanicella actignis]